MLHMTSDRLHILTPNSKKLPKSYFDMVYSNNFNYTYKHYKCSHSGLINLENINESWYNSLFIPNTHVNIYISDKYNILLITFL